MLRWIFIILFVPSTLHAAEPWVPAPDYWGPEDAEGFLRPLASKAEAPTSRPPSMDLQVMALNKKGFLHRTRRAAEPLGEQQLLLQDYARIYSPSQSFVALKYGDAALMILHSHTSISVTPSDGVWVFAFTGERGLARISTRGYPLALSLQPADPQTAWKNAELELAADSDLYVKYDRDTVIAYTIRGHMTSRWETTRPLESMRPEGLIWEWEQKQLRRVPGKPYEIQVFAGQELLMEADAAYHFQIGLPHADTWQNAMARTSPQLMETTDTNQPLTAALLELRKNWLKNMMGPVTANKENLYRLLQEGQWEEAYELVKTAESDADLEYKALAAICLYRLQQEAFADKKQSGIDSSSLWADITKQESLRSRLRRKARRDVNAPGDFRHARIPTDELYLLATNEQARGRWRSALDLWERWQDSANPSPLQESFEEWQRHLDGKKPWSYAATLELGWSNNVLHLPSDEAAPPEIGHRSSWLVRSSQKLPYLLERSAAFSVRLEPSLQFAVYQHTGLADLQRFEAVLALPLGISLPFDGQSLLIKPYISRLSQGSGGLDRFGYEMAWTLPIGNMMPEFIWAQEQNLDFAPTREHRLDALTGERVGILDRSVRLHSLGVRSGAIEAFWQIWDYRYAGSEEDDRQRLSLRGQYQREFPYDLSLNLQGTLHQDLFSGTRSSLTGFDLKADLKFLYWHRREPSLSVEQSLRQSADKERSYQETRILSGIQYRW
ncbi:MAG TPA: hypothetical protein VFO10_22265 [Oligoflexus sp.]|uniref:hypothetical protein n=1 Tax=Oligoflexus sp. TaxID=1971216 RepID=UPI002D7FAA87|nr:hypothetical protein [Oligoflexus sp.]HET9240003.1 hypothetical protein [Oligoflexus sp.]